MLCIQADVISGPLLLAITSHVTDGPTVTSSDLGMREPLIGAVVLLDGRPWALKHHKGPVCREFTDQRQQHIFFQ